MAAGPSNTSPTTDMKLITFERAGQQSYGAVIADGIFDLGSRYGDRFGDLRAVLAADALKTVQHKLDGVTPDFGLSEVRFLPVIPNPDKILCVGLNYETHRLETGRPASEYPAIFTRFADTQIGHEQPIVRPRVSSQLDYEGELAVIIGRGGRYIPESRALGYIAGYACYNDVTVRDWQRHTQQFTPGKNFPGTGALGPWLVTADEISDVRSLALTTRLNGAVVQHASLEEMIFPVERLVAYLSSFTLLQPGDIICTGTPGGVGFKRQPALFMAPGDLVEVEVSGIGTLSNRIEDESLT
jgi:2-keto-4-pentenoate hydratase/2-oxohepta-3-ene-1,7-dioic acid hydratase in catechol pathway